MINEQSMIINLRLLQKKFRQALIFSIFESLEPGKSILISNNEPLTDLKEQLGGAGLINADIQTLDAGPARWTISVKKNEEKSKVGCCGICGGN